MFIHMGVVPEKRPQETTGKGEGLLKCDTTYHRYRKSGDRGEVESKTLQKSRTTVWNYSKNCAFSQTFSGITRENPDKAVHKAKLESSIVSYTH